MTLVSENTDVSIAAEFNLEMWLPEEKGKFVSKVW